VKFLGDFTNVRSNGEHQWGYTSELWIQDGRILGLFSGDSSSIAVGDPPTGLIVDQAFDAKTGRFSFSAQLPYSRYSFQGYLTKSTLKGRLINTTWNQSEEIILKKSKDDYSELLGDFPSYEDWKAHADRILKRLGPK
jgi:hypothetical protein